VTEVVADPYEHQRAVYWQSPFLKFLDFRQGALSPGKAEVSVMAGPELMNRGNAVHGGVLAALLDTVLSQAIHTEVTSHTPLVTIELKVNYLAPARQGELVAEAEVIQVGGSVAVASGFVRDSSGTRVAFGVGTFRLFHQRDSAKPPTS
jgi:acyl-CoA thioesterase